MLAKQWPKGRLYARAVFAGLATFGAIFIPLVATAPNAGAKVMRMAAANPPAAPAPGAQEVTGPVGTLPDGTFPPGVTVIAKLPELSTATSNTYLTSTGSRILMSYEGTVNYKDSNGHFQPIDDSAVATSGGGFHNGANTYQASVPSSLTQPVSVTAGAATLSFSLNGASSGTAAPAVAPALVPPTGVTGSASNDTVTFAKPLPSTDISYTFGPTGLAETLSLAASTAPDTYTWSLKPGPGLSATKTPDGSIVLSNATGATVMVLVAPTIEDANNLVGPPPTMSLSPDGTTVTLSLAPDAAWLDSARAFPVTIDPSVNTNFAGGSECHIYQNAPTTPECASGTSYLVGYNGLSSNAHTMFRFDSLTSSVPYDSLVQNAYFNVYEQGALNSNSIPISLNSIANETWSGTTATWNYYAGTSSWVNPGGDFAPTPAAQAQNAGTANGWLQWDPVQQVQAWVNGADLTTSGNPASVNQGFMLTAPNGAANTISITNWRGSATTQYPYLLVTYTPRIGTGSAQTSLKTQIDDKTTLAVNAANGDLNVDTSLFNIKGVGLPLGIDQNYDSMGATQTSLGTSTQGAAWSLSSSFDQPLLVVRGYLSNIVIDLIASDGTNAVFSNQNPDTTFPTPPGLNATLKPAAGSTFTLTFHPSGEVWTFSLIPGHYGAYFHLASVKDRNNDTVTYNYDSTGTMLTSVSDTEGRSVTVNYNSNNLVSSVVDSTGRTVSYTYSGSSGTYRLATASYGGSTTTYAYDANGNLNEITDPIGNITTVGYNSSQQVTSVTRVTNNVTLAGNTTTYSYAPSSAGAPTTPGTTTVTDPNAHGTKYQYDPWDRVSKVTDANNNAEASTYNAQSSATQLTDAMASPGITSLSYDLNNNLTSITSPASGGSSASQTLGYSTPGTINGGTYLPSSNKDAQGNCTSYTYDTPGNLQGSTAGQGSSCTGAGTTSSSNAYQGDGSTACGGKTGELCSVTDGNGHVTTYGYDANGEVTSVTPPSPQGATTLTYDALSRPHTVATPTGTATYTYDVWDRITGVAYTSGPSLSYNYDADGNLKQRVDPSGTTTFSYDTLNRLTAEHLPSGADGCSGSLTTGITLGYDAASNLTTYCDGAGTTTYAYDPGNRVTSLAEPGGSCPATPTFPNSTLCTGFAYNNDNNRTTTTYPGGATLAAAYDPAGDQTSAVGKAAAGGTALTSYAYSYAIGTNQTQLRQSMTENDTNVTNVTTNYGYSAQNQLLSATNTTTNTALEYFYDPAGNRCNANASSPPSAITSCTSPTYNYNSANQLTSGPSGSYSYDSSGEEQSSPQLSNLTYNTAAQTTSITPSGMSAVAHSYADIGQSLLTTDGSTTLFSGPLGLDRATVGGTNTYFVRDPQGTVVGERTGTSATLYFLKDALGSVTAAINGTGSTVSNRFSYDSYGNQTVVSGTTYEPVGYAGGYHNGNTGLTKFGTRYYDATTGRWTQVDPIGGSIANPSTLNGYIYAGDDPINSTDPTGNFSISSLINGIIGGVVGGAFGLLCEAGSALLLTIGCIAGAAFVGAGVTGILDALFSHGIIPF